MGCLTLLSERRDLLRVSSERTSPLSIGVGRADALTLATEHLPDFGISTERREALSIGVALICTISKDMYYLRVSPEETQWVSEWDSAMYDVESNTSWKVL